MTDQHRRFPPPWDVDDTGSCFIVRDANGQALGYVYYENEPGRGTAAGLLTRDEARRIALNVAKLPELAKRPQYWACHGESIRRPTVYLPGRAAVLAGLGITQAPHWLFAADIGAGTVRRILRDHEPGKIAISAVRPASRRQPSKVAVFVDFLAELLADKKIR